MRLHEIQGHCWYQSCCRVGVPFPPASPESGLYGGRWRAGHDHGYLPDRVNRGWKPLPQSKSLKLTSPILFLGSEEFSFSIKLAALAARPDIPEPMNPEPYEPLTLNL